MHCHKRPVMSCDCVHHVKTDDIASFSAFVLFFCCEAWNIWPRVPLVQLSMSTDHAKLTALILLCIIMTQCHQNVFFLRKCVRNSLTVADWSLVYADWSNWVSSKWGATKDQNALWVPRLVQPRAGNKNKPANKQSQLKRVFPSLLSTTSWRKMPWLKLNSTARGQVT